MNKLRSEIFFQIKSKTSKLFAEIENLPKTLTFNSRMFQRIFTFLNLMHLHFNVDGYTLLAKSESEISTSLRFFSFCQYSIEHRISMDCFFLNKYLSYWCTCFMLSTLCRSGKSFKCKCKSCSRKQSPGGALNPTSQRERSRRDRGEATEERG